jgi:hypothetical protein
LVDLASTINNKKNMNFKIAEIPEISGMSNFDSLISGDKTYVSFIKKGLPFIVTEGDIFDQNGVPFRNEEFKLDFSDLIKKTKISKFTIIGIIGYGTMPKNQENINKLAVLFSKKSNYAAIKHNISIEASEMIFDVNKDLPYKARAATLKSFVDYLSKTEPRIKLQTVFNIDEFNETKANRLSAYAIRNNASMLIRKDNSKYLCGSSDFNELNMIIFNPFEIKTIRVDNIVSHSRMVDNKEIGKVSAIDFKYKGVNYSLDVSGENQSRLDYIYESKYRREKLYMDFMVAESSEEVFKITLT